MDENNAFATGGRSIFKYFVKHKRKQERRYGHTDVSHNILASIRFDHLSNRIIINHENK